MCVALPVFRMKEVAVENHKVLVVRTDGRYSAVGSRCTHYNAPLVKGEGLAAEHIQINKECPPT